MRLIQIINGQNIKAYEKRIKMIRYKAEIFLTFS